MSCKLQDDMDILRLIEDAAGSIFKHEDIGMPRQ
jgi:hypothetical protein